MEGEGSGDQQEREEGMSDLISRQAAMDDAREELKRIQTSAIRAMEVISRLPSAEPEINKQKLIQAMNAGIIATNTEDVYSCGMRNGIRWCRALLEDNPPKFEDASQYAEPERKKGKWISLDDFRGKYNTCGYKCSECGEHSEYEENFCPNCGSYNGGEQDEID